MAGHWTNPRGHGHQFLPLLPVVGEFSWFQALLQSPSLNSMLNVRKMTKSSNPGDSQVPPSGLAPPCCVDSVSLASTRILDTLNLARCFGGLESNKVSRYPNPSIRAASSSPPPTRLHADKRVALASSFCPPKGTGRRAASPPQYWIRVIPMWVPMEMVERGSSVSTRKKNVPGKTIFISKEVYRDLHKEKVPTKLAQDVYRIPNLQNGFSL